jgi:hypothetical protein
MRTNNSQARKKQLTSQSNDEPEITVAPATLGGDSTEFGIIEVEAYQVPTPVTVYRSKSTTAELPPFQDTLADDLPTVTAQPVPPMKRQAKKARIAAESGEELLAQMKRHRKAATVNSGLCGGLVGLILLGPLGALAVGAGSAMVTKHSLKRKEKALRKSLQGRLHEPVYFAY